MRALSLLKLHPHCTLHLLFGFSGFVEFSELAKLILPSLFLFFFFFKICNPSKPGPITLEVGRGLAAQTPSRKAQLPDQPTWTLGATRIRRPQGSPQMEHRARAHLTVEKE